MNIFLSLFTPYARMDHWQTPSPRTRPFTPAPDLVNPAPDLSPGTKPCHPAFIAGSGVKTKTDAIEGIQNGWFLFLSMLYTRPRNKCGVTRFGAG